MRDRSTILRAIADQLKGLRLAVGAPSYDALTRLQPSLRRSTISDVLGGRSASSLDFVVAFVQACRAHARQTGQEPEPSMVDVQRWRHSWLQMRRELGHWSRDAGADTAPQYRGGDPGRQPADGPADGAAGRTATGQLDDILSEPASWGTANLPRRPTPAFVGRAAALLALAAQLDEHPGIMIGQAVQGLGGVGKSELALQYAFATRQRYHPLFWVPADTAENVTDGLARLARSLDLPGTDALNTADAADCAVRWLATRKGWLVILDNVTDPADIAPFLATVVHGRVLVTSQRDIDWAAHGLQPLRLDPLSRQASVDLLGRRSGRHGEATDVQALAEDLGDLPLALRHAAAYLKQRPHVSVAQYRQRLAERPARVLDRSEVAGDVHPVSRTWQVARREIATQNTLAVHLLDTLAYLAPDEIWIEFLLRLADDPLDVEDAVALAASYNMISRHGDAVTVHRLVQAVIRTSHQDLSPLRRAVGLLVACVPPGDAEVEVTCWSRWRCLSPHIDAIAAGPPAEADAALEIDLAVLFDRCAVFHRGQGQHQAAIGLFTKAIAIRTRRLGVDHPDTITARYGLAGAYWSAGRYEEAITLGERALADRAEVLGPEHPDTLRNASNLAVGYREMGRHAEAIDLSARTLATRQRVLGPDHPDTLQSQNNLAGCYRAVGRYADAVALYETTLARRQEFLGPDHPDTLQSRNNLAGGYVSVGRTSEAIALHEVTLAARMRLLGPTHPDTLTSRHNLADTYHAVGRTAEAIAIHQDVLAARAELLGSDHPDTAQSRRALARCLSA